MIARLPSRYGDRMPALGSIFRGVDELSVILPNQYQSVNVTVGLDLVALTVNLPPLVSAWLCKAIPSCLRLFWHFTRSAASRTFCTAGNSRPIRTAMMAITTSSSMRVNAAPRNDLDIFRPSSDDER